MCQRGDFVKFRKSIFNPKASQREAPGDSDNTFGTWPLDYLGRWAIWIYLESCINHVAKGSAGMTNLYAILQLFIYSDLTTAACHLILAADAIYEQLPIQRKEIITVSAIYDIKY